MTILQLVNLAALQPVSTMPRNRMILAYGAFKMGDGGPPEMISAAPMLSVVYWDSLDEAWSVPSHPWSGPFMLEPLGWVELPEIFQPTG